MENTAVKASCSVCMHINCSANNTKLCKNILCCVVFCYMTLLYYPKCMQQTGTFCSPFSKVFSAYFFSLQFSPSVFPHTIYNRYVCVSGFKTNKRLYVETVIASVAPASQISQGREGRGSWLIWEDVRKDLRRWSNSTQEDAGLWGSWSSVA